MPNADDFKINRIDFTALKNRVEGQVMGSIINMNPAVTDVQKRQLKEALAVFERHNIGAIEALDIMREISEVYSE